jgi:quercetin dioxygenase-like cupin family protein
VRRSSEENQRVDQQQRRSIGPALARRRLLGILAGMGLLTGLRPALAQESIGQEKTQRRQTMEITRNGSRPSSKGPEQYFSGSVRVDPVFQVGDPARLNAGSVTFEPGARTAWHTHPLGQTLIVTFGFGWVQHEGGPIEEVRPGDVVWFPPGLRHWHGATPTTAMTHIAVTESLNGKTVDWMEKVSDDQYRK